MFNRECRKIIKAVVPPCIFTWCKSFSKANTGIIGPFMNWEAATRYSNGYNAPVILEKIKNATLQVKNNQRLSVRDGIVFDTPQYAYPLLTALLKITAENNNKLTVVDFGGGLGSTYYDFTRLYPQADLHWYIIEQEAFVECGKAHFQNSQLHFMHDLDVLPRKPDIVIVSSALQYIPQPYAQLDKLLALNSPYFLLDRTTFSNLSTDEERIFVERVPAHIYAASYPFWLLSYSKISKYFEKKYQILFEMDTLEGRYVKNGIEVVSRGVCYKKERHL